jgi:hypothetical protein
MRSFSPAWRWPAPCFVLGQGDIMKRISARKLDLKRETLATLQSTELDAINGGVVYTGCVSGCTQCPGDPRPGPGGPSPFPRPGTSNLLQVCNPGGTGGGLSIAGK